jgi:hypothetical protein
MKIKNYLKLENFKIDNLNKYTRNFRSVIKVILIFIIITVLVKSLFFYRGIYFAPKKSLHNMSIFSTEPEAKKFIDTFEKTKGSVLIDKSHENNFENKDIDTLISRINSRNNKMEFLENADDLQSKLRSANSFVIILPKKEFSNEQIDLIKDFSNKNGKLLLIGDPDRKSNINSIANNFNIIFSDDYLYNLKENDGNFKFIFLKDFSKNDITKKLNKIAVYTSCQILPSERGIAFTDKNTYASSLETNKFAPAVFLNSTLALCDLTFFNQPFNSVFDNNQFISNIADFLTKTDKKFNVADFPYFFKENADIVTTNLGLSGNAINLKNSLSKAGINTNIKRSLNASTDAIIIELFDDFKATPISIAVDENSFRINDLLFDRKDSSLIYLSKGNVTILTILANDKKSIEKTIEILESKEISKSLVSDNLAVISGLKLEEEK